MAVHVQSEDFDPAALIAGLTAGRTDIGGLATFIGQVRDENKGARVTSLTLEHYPGMTEKELARIEAEARQRWPLHDVVIVHRHGRLMPGDNIVFVGTSSSHRQAAFEACQFIMDYLKTDAPFWRLETTADGTEHWVEARQSDRDQRDRWQND